MELWSPCLALWLQLLLIHAAHLGSALAPTGQPSAQPTGKPSSQPSRQPSAQPTCKPTGQPSAQPTSQPTSRPTGQPSWQPTDQPSAQPTGKPSSQPSRQPSAQPTCKPTRQPTTQPTRTGKPSFSPTPLPTRDPTAPAPTFSPAIPVIQTVGLTINGLTLNDVTDVLKSSLKKGMAATLGIDLSKVLSLTIEPARRLRSAVEDRKLSSSDYSAEHTRRKLGGGLQTSYVVETTTTSGSAATAAADTAALIKASKSTFVLFVVADLVAQQQGLAAGVTLSLSDPQVIDQTPTLSPTLRPTLSPTFPQIIPAQVVIGMAVGVPLFVALVLLGLWYRHKTYGALCYVPSSSYRSKRSPELDVAHLQSARPGRGSPGGAGRRQQPTLDFSSFYANDDDGRFEMSSPVEISAFPISATASKKKYAAGDDARRSSFMAMAATPADQIIRRGSGATARASNPFQSPVVSQRGAAMATAAARNRREASPTVSSGGGIRRGAAAAAAAEMRRRAAQGQSTPSPPRRRPVDLDLAEAGKLKPPEGE